jgi:hypothetical protein
MGGASERAFGEYRAAAPRRARAWRLEQTHALAFVSEEAWRSLGLDLLFEDQGLIQTASDPARLGRELRRLLEAGRQSMGSQARIVVETAGSTSEPLLAAAVDAAVRSLNRVARPLARSAHSNDLIAIVLYLPDIARESGLEQAVADLTRAVYTARPDPHDRALILDAVQSSAAMPRKQIDRLLSWEHRMQSPADVPPSPATSDDLALMPEFPSDVDEAASVLAPGASPSVVAPGGTNDVEAIQPFEPVATAPFVNVGFADGHDVRQQVDRRRLSRDRLYWFWVELGPQAGDAIAGDQEPVSGVALEGTEEIEVALFPDPELEVSSTRIAGTVAVVDRGVFPVLQPATALPESDVGALAGRRLFFGVRTPNTNGVFLLRCGLYVRGLLVHLEQVTVPVGRVSEELGVRTTFRLVQKLSAHGLQGTSLHRLSIYTNVQPDGSHGFSFYGADNTGQYAAQVQLDGHKVQTMIRTARETLRHVAWNEADEYDPTRHDSSYEPDDEGHFATLDKVEADLVRLAVVGRRLWFEFAQKLGQSTGFPRLLEERMREPGLVQLAPRDDPDMVLPVQLLYDRMLDTANEAALSLCSAARAWLGSAAPADDVPCRGGCSESGDGLHVCPAGFWGLRHAVSITASRPNDCGASLLEAISGDDPSGRLPALVGLTSDEAVVPFTGPHLEHLERLFTVTDTDNRDHLGAELRGGSARLVYFLCHMRHDGPVPVIVVGPVDGPGIEALTLDDWQLDLCRGRPLVFLNACNSAAPSPERLLGLVDQFFRYGAAAAVGTEITVFVSLAIPFAEALLERFASAEPLGESIRQARVRLLGKGNPLGLAYVAFGLPGFHVER